MSWKAVIGGVAGSMFGPLGTIAGAAIGAALENVEDDDVQGQVSGLPVLEAELSFINDEDGTVLNLSVPTVPDRAFIAVHAREEDGAGYVKSKVPEFSDDDGDFIRYIRPASGQAYFYLPKGIVEPDFYGEIHLSFRAIIPRENQDPIILGETRFSFEHPDGDYAAVNLWRPFIYLCMYVAHADGHLDRSEVAAIKNILLEQLEIPKHESSIIKGMMRSYSQFDVEKCVNEIYRRFPHGDPKAFLECLAEVAKADNKIHPNEIAVIRQVYLDFGYPQDQWPEEKIRLELDDLDEFRSLLGVTEHATKREIQRAFRQKAAEYHPDKYHNLPTEFQNVAKEMMQKLSAAKEALLASL